MSFQVVCTLDPATRAAVAEQVLEPIRETVFSNVRAIQGLAVIGLGLDVVNILAAPFAADNRYERTRAASRLVKVVARGAMASAAMLGTYTLGMLAMAKYDQMNIEADICQQILSKLF